MYEYIATSEGGKSIFTERKISHIYIIALHTRCVEYTEIYTTLSEKEIYMSIILMFSFGFAMVS